MCLSPGCLHNQSCFKERSNKKEKKNKIYGVLQVYLVCLH